MGPRLLVVGSANLDLVFRTPRFPRTGETLLGGEFASFPGGKGANQAVAIAKLGGNVGFVGCIGRDAFGDALEASLQEAGVDTSLLLRHDSAPTGCAAIMVDADGANEIIVAPGANAQLRRAPVQQAVAANQEAWVLAQLEIPLEAVEATAESRHFILNPAPACELPLSIYPNCFAIVPNETEVEILTGIAPLDLDSTRAAAHDLLRRGVQNAVITLGEKGCFWSNGVEENLLPAVPVQAVDTVAAGDAFCGALAMGLSQDLGWEEALRFANRAGAFATTKRGAQSAMPTTQDLATLTVSG